MTAADTEGTEVEGSMVHRWVGNARFRAAAAAGRIEFHYQPIVEQRSGRAVAAEALVRWRHPRHGLIAPAAFLPHVEGTRTERVLNRLVIDDAARQAAEWAGAGQPLQVMMNLSPPCLNDGLSETLTAAIERWRLSPSLLHIELTERGDAYEETTSYAKALEQIRDLGVTISLDDFGRARSSLLRLTTLPVDALKIDRGFVTAIEDSKSAEVLRNAIHLGHTLGLKVVAEGVETAAQWHRLHEWGADFAQGFLLSPAMPAEEVLPWIEGERADLIGALRRSRSFVERRTGFTDRRYAGDRRKPRRRSREALTGRPFVRLRPA
jgi:EAL domain-containing protein (putative c-di-GMP-specific phosphodiesterase class I)